MYTVSATDAAIIEDAAVKDLLLSSLNDTSITLVLARLAEAAPCT